VLNAAGAGPGYHMLQGEAGVIPVPPPGVVGKNKLSRISKIKSVNNKTITNTRTRH